MIKMFDNRAVAKDIPEEESPEVCDTSSPDVPVVQTYAPKSVLEEDAEVLMEKIVPIANQLATIIKEQKLTVPIRNKDYVLVEGWTTLGALLKVFPIVEYVKKLDREDMIAYEACVVAKTFSGTTVGRGIAICSDNEQLKRRDGSKYKRWEDEYAVMSMAQTRATSKALRLPLGWVMTLAGFSATPAEEVEFLKQDDGSELHPPKDEEPDKAKTKKEPISKQFPDDEKVEPLYTDLDKYDYESEQMYEDKNDPGAYRAIDVITTEILDKTGMHDITERDIGSRAHTLMKKGWCDEEFFKRILKELKEKY
jgi:hypothetical protein